MKPKSDYITKGTLDILDEPLSPTEAQQHDRSPVAEPTPLPWFKTPTSNGWLICSRGDPIVATCGPDDATTEANADLILRACNSHEALLSALRPFAEAAQEVRGIGGIHMSQQYLWKPQNGNRVTAGITAQHLRDAVAAIALAERQS